MAVEICDAPEAGNFENIDIEQIRKALGTAGVNLARLCITGSAECRVFRPAEPVESAESPRVGAAAQSAQSGPAEARPVTLESSVRKFLDERLANLRGRVEVRFGAANRNVLGLAGEDMTFVVRPRGSSLLGLITMDVDVVKAGKVIRSIPVLAEVGLYKDVVVSSRPINSGGAIGADDITLQERRFTRAEDIGLDSISLAINRQARHYIEPGRMIGVRDVRDLPLVKRGDAVTVWFRKGGLSARGSAKAMRDGVQGDRIEVKAEPGGQTYSVVVTGPKTVEAQGA